MSLDTQSGSIPSGIFNAFRKNGENTYYGENQTAVKADLIEAGIIFAGCILAVSLFSILPGIHGKSRPFTFIWIAVGVFVGTSILVTNYSPDWEVAEVSTTTYYKAGTGEHIKAKIGLHIGLRGVNITLKGNPTNQLNETINYNEEMRWSWGQGRIGFGPYASEFNQEYRAAQFRGLPLPILWIAEYFTLDGEGIRWGRFYRESGLYAHMCIWLAFALWLLANIMLFVLLRYAAYLMIFTGISMCTANIIKHTLRNPLELAIPFTPDHVLTLHYGPAFWLCLVTGLLCFSCGCLVLILDLRFPSIIAIFFSADPRQEDDKLQKEDTVLSTNSSGTNSSGESGGLYEIVVDPVRKSPETETKMKSSDVKVYDEDEWVDNSDGSDSDFTDDEWDDAPQQVQATATSKHKGILSRIQASRRIPSAKQNSRTARKPTSPRRRSAVVHPINIPRWKF